MDWILVLALATFAVLGAFLLWNRQSTKRMHESGGRATGVGGRNDPLSGNTEGVRKPDELRRGLDAAAAEGPHGADQPTGRPPPGEEAR